MCIFHIREVLRNVQQQGKTTTTAKQPRLVAFGNLAMSTNLDLHPVTSLQPLACATNPEDTGFLREP